MEIPKRALGLSEYSIEYHILSLPFLSKWEHWSVRKGIAWLGLSILMVNFD